jgi:hypothetical protein
MLAHLLNIQLAVNFKSKPEYIIIGAIWPEDRNVVLYSITLNIVFIAATGHAL